MLGGQIDAQPAKAAWATALGSISYDLLSDLHPHGEVAAKYGVFRTKEGFSERAIFVIDKQGKVAWSRVYAIPEQPANAEVLAALEPAGVKLTISEGEVMSKAEGLGLQPPTNLAAGVRRPGARMRAGISS